MHALRQRIQPLVTGLLAVALFAALAAGGDQLARIADLPVPGAVLGLAAYAAACAAYPRQLAWTLNAARTLTRLLGALIVPAAVGLAGFGPVLEQHAGALAVVLVVGTLLTALLTAAVYTLTLR